MSRDQSANPVGVWVEVFVGSRGLVFSCTRELNSSTPLRPNS